MFFIQTTSFLNMPKRKGRPNKTRFTICFLIDNGIREIYDITSYKKLEESINKRKNLEAELNQPKRESILDFNFEDDDNPLEDEYDDFFEFDINTNDFQF